MKPTSLWRATLTILGKDFIAELRSRELLTTMGLFALLSIFVFSFALELDRIVRQESVSGVLWVTVVFASILGLNRSMAVEREGGFEAVFNAPIPRVAIFWGKCLANLAFTLCVAALMLPIMVVLYNMESLISGWLILALVLGMFGFTAVGTLLATITVQTRARDSLLPILLLPLGLPILLAAVRLTIHILTGAPPEQYTTWLGVLLAVDVVYVLLCVVLFPYLNED